MGSRAKKRDILGKIKVFSSQKSQIPESQEKNTCYTLLKQRKRSHPQIPSKKTRHTGKIKVFSCHKSQIPESQEKHTCYTFLKHKLDSFQAKKARSHYPEQKNATYWEKLKTFQAKKARSQNPNKKTHVILCLNKEKGH